LNIELQVAHPSDLLAGRGTTDSDGETAAAAVERMRKDKVRALPDSSLVPIGGSGSTSGGS
jgi:type IV pilus biogenesis protein CpaD/CtpE